MKKLATFLFILSFISLKSQTQNHRGLYVDNEGNLFSGKILKFQNEVKQEYTVKDGVINGEVNYYYASGSIMETGIFTDGKKDQKWTRYNVQGLVTATAFYDLGKKTGTWLVFDDNGKKRFEMNYLNGDKTGTWTSWDENGAIANLVNYNPN